VRESVEKGFFELSGKEIRSKKEHAQQEPLCETSQRPDGCR
jgi:hypothetical protein